MLHDISQFVRFPLFGPLGAVLSLLLLGALLLSIVGSLWIVRIPGRVGVLEVGRMKRIGGGAVVLMFVGVLCCLTGAAYLHFPVSSPKEIVLSSRARSLASTTEAGRESWSRRWDALLDEAEHRSLLDAGELVDRVCQALSEHPPAGGWDSDDPSIHDHIRGVAWPLILEYAQNVSISNLEGLRPRIGDPSRLPLWVIETVEIGVLKSLTVTHNARAVRVLAQQRVTAIGRTWDESVESYLTADPTRYEPLKIIIDGGTQQPPVLLVSFYRSVQTGRDVRAVLLFDIDSERLGQISVELQQNLAKLQLYSDPKRPEQSVLSETEVQLNLDASGTQFVSVLFEDVTLREVAGVRQIGSGMYLPAPITPSGETLPFGNAHSITIRADQNVVGWSHSIHALRSDDFASWRSNMIYGRLTNGREPAELLRGDSNAGVAPMSVLVTDRGIWIGPSNALSEPPRKPYPLETLGNKGRGRSLPTGAPGIYSWDGVQLSDGKRFSLGQQTEEDQRLALGRTLTKSMRHGDQSQTTGLDPALVVQTLVASDAGGRGSRVPVTYLGIDPNAAGLVFQEDGSPPDNYDEVRFLSFWTEVFRAAHTASRGVLGSVDERVGDEATTHPFVLLDTALQNRLRARSVGGALRVFAIGLLMFTLASVTSSLLANTRDHA